jgi:Domain of Unknown Function with PDB structure (DUF3857)
MHTVRALCAALLALVSVSVLANQGEFPLRDATPEELAMKGVAFAPGAPAAILEWDHYQDDHESYATEYVRIKIFERTATEYGNVEIEYEPGFSTIKHLRARTIRPDGSAIEYNGTPFDKLIVHKGERKLVAKTFSLPDVQPGSIVEYAYLRTWTRYTVPLSSHWVLQRELPVVRQTLWYRPANEFAAFFTYQGLPKAKQLQGVRDHFELVLTDMPPYVPEPLSPPEPRMIARIDFRYTGTDLDAAHFWDNVSKALTDRAEKLIGDGVNADAVVAGATTPEEKLRRLYARAQQVRNLSFGTGSGEEPEELSSAAEVPRKGAATRKEIVHYFVALARGAGFDAHIAAVTSRDEGSFDPRITDLTQMDDVLALVTLDGQPRFFDPGTPLAPFGVLPWRLTGTAGLKLAPGPAVFIKTPVPTPRDAITRRVAELHVDGDHLKGAATITWTGQEALVRRLDALSDSDAAAGARLEKEVRAWLPAGSTVTLHSAGPWKTPDEPLVLHCDIDIAGLGSFTAARALLPLAVFSATARNPFAAAERHVDVDFRYPSQTEDEIVLHVPDGYVLDALPAATNKDRKALVYKTEWTAGDRAVTLRRVFTINAVILGVPLYSQVRDFWQAAAAADQDSVVLRKP